MATSTAETDNSEDKFVTVEKIKPDLRKKDPPLVDVKVSNPVTYIKSWWKRVMGSEGLDIRIKIKPVTAILISIVVVCICLGLTVPFKIPFLDQNAFSSSRETAFVGILRFSVENNKFFLETNDSEVINLEIPQNLDLDDFVGRKVFALGSYDDNDRFLIVDNVSNLEIFPATSIPIPTIEPTPTPVETLSSSPIPTFSPEITIEPEPTVVQSIEPTATSTDS